MRARLGVAAAAALLLAAAAPAPPGALGASSGLAPDAAAWWRAGPLSSVTGSGLDASQLLVEGLGPQAAHQAVAGLSFATGAATPVTLRVPVVSAAPAAMSVQACAVLAPFEPVAGGPPEDIPDHDCERAAPGVLDEGVLVVDVVGDLGAAGALRLLLVPTGPGRLVLDAGRAVLEVSTPADSGGPAAPAPPPPDPRRPAAALTPGAVVPPRVAPGGGRGAVPAGERAAPAPPAVAPRLRTARPAAEGDARELVALVMALVLGTVTVLNRNGAARLRPAALPWRGRPAATTQNTYRLDGFFMAWSDRATAVAGPARAADQPAAGGVPGRPDEPARPAAGD